MASEMPVLYNIDGVPTCGLFPLMDTKGIFKEYVYITMPWITILWLQKTPKVH